MKDTFSLVKWRKTSYECPSHYLHIITQEKDAYFGRLSRGGEVDKR